ncbi:hypothetical protein NHJ13051_005767 [Beauveria bassiana]
MLLNFRLVATGLAALAGCAQALNMTNFTTNVAGCGTPGLSLEQWTHSEEVLAQKKNTTKRQVAQRHRIPTYITVLAKNNTVKGGNIAESQIQQLLDEFKKFYSYGIELDTSVDKTRRYTRPDLFDPNSGMFTGDRFDVRAEYHRGEGDYASLNVIFLFRLEDWHKNETTTKTEPNGETWTSVITSSGGTSGFGSIPLAELWKASNAKELVKSDGILVSSAIIPNMAYPGSEGSLSIFSHEVGHWLGLRHTDHLPHKDSWGTKACDRDNDGIDDTPTHMIDENVRRIMRTCPPQGQINTCQHLDSRPDLIYNLMTPTLYGCKVDGLTDGQKQRTLDVYEKFRMPYKGQMQQMGRWVQPQSQQPKGQQAQEVEAPQEEEPQEKEPQVKKPQEKEPQVKKPQEKEPQVKKPQEKGPQDQQAQDEQGDWRQKQIAQLQSRMKEAWDEYRHLDKERRQQIQQQIQQNVKDCLERVDQDYKQRGESLTASMQGQYNQLQADRQGMSEYLKQFSDRPEWIKEESNRQEEGFARQQKECEQQEGESRQNLKQGLQKDREGCRQSGKEDYDQRLQAQGKWSKNYAEELRKAESRAQQIINDMMGMQ